MHHLIAVQTLIINKAKKYLSNNFFLIIIPFIKLKIQCSNRIYSQFAKYIVIYLKLMSNRTQILNQKCLKNIQH